MNHDELIKSMKDKGITVKVDNGNKLEFSNGETYVKDSHSGKYKKTKNYMENKINICKLVESKLFSEKFGDTKDTFSIDKNKLQLDFEHAKPVSVNQGYFGIDSDGNIIGDKKDGYGNGGLIKQYKSPSAALYASGSGYWTTRELEEGDVVGYIGIIKEVAMVPVILKKKA